MAEPPNKVENVFRVFSRLVGLVALPGRNAELKQEVDEVRSQMKQNLEEAHKRERDLRQELDDVRSKMKQNMEEAHQRERDFRQELDDVRSKAKENLEEAHQRERDSSKRATELKQELDKERAVRHELEQKVEAQIENLFADRELSWKNCYLLHLKRYCVLA